jgi:hypothetical protein
MRSRQRNEERRKPIKRILIHRERLHITQTFRRFNMAQLWGGRFTKQTDRLVYNFNQSIGFDQKFFHQDVRGSRAHVRMLAKQEILTEEERDQILAGLDSIEEDVYTYDDKGNLLKKHIEIGGMDAEEPYDETYTEVVTDDKGNWISRKANGEVQKRVIEYYY